MPSKKSVRLFTALALALAVSIVQAVIVRAQESARPAQQTVPDQATSNLEEFYQANISLNQPSGSVAQFIETIRQESPKLNIVVTENAAAYRLPEIKLTDVPIRGTLSLLSTLTDNLVEVNFQSQIEGSEANLVLISSQEGNNPNVSLTVRVLNVKRLLKEADRDALLSALDEGYRMMGNEPNQVEIKIHEATGLLFVKGTPAQLMMAESIVQEIERGFATAPNSNPYGQSPLIEVEGKQTPTLNNQ